MDFELFLDHSGMKVSVKDHLTAVTTLRGVAGQAPFKFFTRLAQSRFGLGLWDFGTLGLWDFGTLGLGTRTLHQGGAASPGHSFGPDFRFRSAIARLLIKSKFHLRFFTSL